jgi:transcriptional regulator with XRE-family HTH domain
MNLREIADKCGVSKSYISQVVHGKRPASAKVALELSSAGISVKQIEANSGLQIRWGALKAFGGFDSHTLPLKILSKFSLIKKNILDIM